MSWIQQVNELPQFNIAAAFDLGFKVPDILYLDKIDTIEDPENWEVLPHASLAIKKVGGIELTSTAWYDGDEVTNDVMSIHDRWLLSGGQGGMLDDNCITMFQEFNPLKKQLVKLGEALKTKAPEFTGLISLTCNIVGNDYYYSGIRFGVTPDLALCYATFFGEDIESIAYKLDIGEEIVKADKFACTTRLYGYPYNERNNMDFDLPNYFIGSDGYIAANTSNRINKVWGKLNARLRRLNMHGLCYRIDGDVKARRMYAMLKNKRYL